MKCEMMGPYEKYNVESWADSIIRAEEIKADKQKMKYVSQLLDKKVKAISSLADIKNAYKEMDEEEEGSEEQD